MYKLPNQPSLNKGILILLSLNAKDANISSSNVYFSFQYNPEKLLHTFSQPIAPAENTSGNTQIPLLEFFNLTFELDSTDLEPQSQSKIATDLGIHPALAMLETMVQPQVVGNQTSMPIVIFKWGAKRSAAVRIVSINVEETAFDTSLNPTSATVNLTLRVLDAQEVNNNAGARSIYSSHKGERATLVEAYKSQTGQVPDIKVTGASSALSPKATAATGSKESKTKISA